MLPHSRFWRNDYCLILRNVILRNDYCFAELFCETFCETTTVSPGHSGQARLSRGDFSTTPVSSKEELPWTRDNILMTCPLSSACSVYLYIYLSLLLPHIGHCFRPCLLIKSLSLSLSLSHPLSTLPSLSSCQLALSSREQSVRWNT